MAHARLSPSSAVRWMSCPGSVALCEGLPDTSSSYADEGTDAHELAAWCLERNADATEMLGEKMSLGTVVTADFASDVQRYVDYVRDVVQSTGGTLLVEQKLNLVDVTGEDAHGTSDAVILAGDELIVIDLKFGMGEKVDA